MALIRFMSIEDYESVYDLWSTTPGLGLSALDDSREGIERYLARNPGTCFVAEKEKRIVGAILSGHDGRRGYIYHAAVSLSERKLGIGTALVSAAMGALEKEGINKVALVALADNETGNAFWELLGFGARDDLKYRNKAIRKPCCNQNSASDSDNCPC